MQSYRLGLLPYFPLAKGLLTGKYSRQIPTPEGARLTKAKETPSDATLQKVEKLAAFASQRGHTLLELAFSWLAAQPVVASVIAGATKPEQLEQNVRAVSWALTVAEMAEIDTLTKPA